MDEPPGQKRRNPGVGLLGEVPVQRPIAVLEKLGMVREIDDVDAAFGSTITGPAKEVETSPRGLVWPPLPHADTAGWQRLLKIAPYFSKHTATCGAAGLSPQTPIEMGSFPYPIFTVYGTVAPELAYSITKVLISGYDIYKDGAPGASGFAVAADIVVGLAVILLSLPRGRRSTEHYGSWDRYIV